MTPTHGTDPPKDDSEYLERLSKAIFTAGLNWEMVENKWPEFRKAFAGFAPAKVAKFTEKDIESLMGDRSIVRNERKIRATIENAMTVLQLEKEYGSVKAYIESFGAKEARLLEGIQETFKHAGPSTARTFLWMAGYPLTPTKEERAWMKGHEVKQSAS